MLPINAYHKIQDTTPPMSSNMHTMMRPVGATLLFFGFLAMASFSFIENKIAIISWADTSESPLVQEDDADERHSAQNETSRALHLQLQQQHEPHLQSRRRLHSPKPELNETEERQQMVNYLGGLYPPVDKDMLPLYLRDTEDTTNSQLFLDMYNPSGEAVKRNRDLVFFWHIPKASGSTMKYIMNLCFGLRRNEQTEEQPSMTYSRENVFNMDTNSPAGLSFSFANQLVNSNTVDVIVSNYFLSGSALFTDMHLGKTFAILRHPAETSLSLFHGKKGKKLTFHDYVASDYYMDNWMVRQLTGTMPWVEMNEAHLDRAKLVMKRKIFVGVLSEIDETMRQLKAHFQWEEKEPNCAREILHSKRANENAHLPLQGGRGGKTWNLLAEKEKWDFSLYHFALELFAKQRERYPPEVPTRG